MNKDIVKQIEKRRRQCLVHRYLYYVKAETLISDQEYDRLERDLRKLVTEFPKEAHKAEHSLMCPTQTVGSSNIDDYPRLIEQIAEGLLKFDKAIKEKKSAEALP